MHLLAGVVVVFTSSKTTTKEHFSSPFWYSQHSVVCWFREVLFLCLPLRVYKVWTLPDKLHTNTPKRQRNVVYSELTNVEREQKKKKEEILDIFMFGFPHATHTGSVRRGRLSGGMVEKCSEKLSLVRSIINSLQAKVYRVSQISRHRENTEWEKIKTETYVDYAFGM